jgi:hypothetical protein
LIPSVGHIFEGVRATETPFSVNHHPKYLSVALNTPAVMHMPAEFKFFYVVLFCQSKPDSLGVQTKVRLQFQPIPNGLLSEPVTSPFRQTSERP